MRHWSGRERDGQPTDAAAKAGKLPSDFYRDRHHWIQTSAHGVRKVRRGRTITVTGALGTPEGRKGGMRFLTRVTPTPDGACIELKVQRVYLESSTSIGDNSLCFLSPPSFAQRFLAYGSHYATHKDGTAQYELLDKQHRQHAEVRVPTRLCVQTDKNGHAWGVLASTETVGFGVLVLEAARAGRATGGELRCTRPRPPAEKKFDEIEFQWSRGPACAGDTETGTFILIPGRSALEIVRRANSLLEERR